MNNFYRTLLVNPEAKCICGHEKYMHNLICETIEVESDGSWTACECDEFALRDNCNE